MSDKKQSTKEETKEEIRAEALKIAVATITKNLGKGSIITGKESVPGVLFSSSGSIKLNEALGGGWARGRIIEVFGPESSGKTTLTLHAVAECQKAGGTAAFIDAEHALDPLYMEALGVDLDKLLLAQPDSGEQALQILEHLTKSGAVDLIVIDSVAALVPQAELEGEIGDSHMGRQARLMGQAMRMVAGAAHTTGTTIMFINQLRMKLGIMFGNPETTPGGNALKFYASQRVDIRRKSGVKEGDQLVANLTKIKIVKNKVGPPFKECELTIRYGKGIDILAELVDIAVERGVIDKAGSWYSFGESKIGQGMNQVVQLLEKTPSLIEEIKEKMNGIP